MNGIGEFDRKAHWEGIYRNKETERLNWYQQRPVIVLDWISSLHLPADARIIDIGAGDSLLADHLLEMGFTDISLLDISTLALERVAERLAASTSRLKWYAEDVLDFHPPHGFHLWHDRAAFHFLSDPEEIDRYVGLVSHAILPGGHMIIGTFSEEGPVQCSGLEVSRYSADALQDVFANDFEPRKWVAVEHVTPGGGAQSFMYCLFQRK